MECTQKENSRGYCIGVVRRPQNFSTFSKKYKLPRFVYHIVKRYTKDSSFEDRKKKSRPRTVRTPAVIKAVKARIQRNPVGKQKT